MGASSERLPSLLRRFSAFGAAGEGGLERLALGEADAAARAALAGLIKDSGLHLHVDRVGNQFGLTVAPDAGQPVILLGSHLDSQPGGGRFDGQVGVLAALLAVLKLRDSGQIPEGMGLGVVNWTNEEGARFQPSVLGSSVFTGQVDLETALGLDDDAGVTVREALHLRDLAGSADLKVRVLAYAELHVEQGAILESEGTDIGIVDRVWAAHKADVTVRGVQTHTGPTPMADRVEALYAAARVITFVHDLGRNRADGRLHTAVAYLRVEPNSPNATPSAVHLKVELRSPDEDVLREAEEQVSAAMAAISADTGADIESVGWSRRRSQRMGAQLVDGAETALRAVGLSTRRMATIAGHDAIVMHAASIPSVLLFIPSSGGITHNAAEHTADEDLERGLLALSSTVEGLCREHHVPRTQ